MEAAEFRQLVLAETEAVYRLAFYLARSADAAADLVQETFARAIASTNTFQSTDRGIRPWLLKILHNVHLAKIGASPTAPTIMEDLHNESIADELEGDPPCWDLSHLKWEEVDDRLRRAINTLPDTYRIVLLLWAVEGLKYEQIAEVLDVALGTVLSRLYRARMMLSKQLSELAGEKGIKIEADFRF